MASAWGVSWGSAWGNAWGQIAGEQAQAPASSGTRGIQPAQIFLLVQVDLRAGPGKVQCEATVEYPKQQRAEALAAPAAYAVGADVLLTPEEAVLSITASVSYAEHNERMRRILIALAD